VPLYLAVLILLAVAACRRRHVPDDDDDDDDTRLVLVMTSPVAVGLFVVELLRVLCRYKVVDDLGGVVQELSELLLYAVVAVVPALCFAVAPSVRCTRQRRAATAAPGDTAAAAAVADETIRLSTVDRNESNDAQQ